MWRKLAGYSLVSLSSFCFFTVLFHTMAQAQMPIAFLTPTPNSPDQIEAQSEPNPSSPDAIRSQSGQNPTVSEPIASSPTPSPAVMPSPTNTPIPTQTPLPTNTPTPLPTNTPTPIASEPTLQPTVPAATDLESLFNKYSAEYSVDKELLKRIARCESGFNNNAENSGYVGMYQFADQSWQTVRRTMNMDPNPDLRRNAQEAIRTAAFMISHGQQSAWPNC